MTDYVNNFENLAIKKDEDEEVLWQVNMEGLQLANIHNLLFIKPDWMKDTSFL